MSAKPEKSATALAQAFAAAGRARAQRGFKNNGNLLKHVYKCIVKNDVAGIRRHAADLQRRIPDNDVMIYACEQSFHRGTLETLIACGFDPSRPDSSGVTPFMVACNGSHRDTMRLLVAHNVDVAATDATGKNAIHYMVQGGDLTYLPHCIAAGADINGGPQATPLALAVKMLGRRYRAATPDMPPDYSIIDRLIAHGADEDTHAARYFLSTGWSDLIDNARYYGDQKLVRVIKKAHKNAQALKIRAAVDTIRTGQRKPRRIRPEKQL